MSRRKNQSSTVSGELFSNESLTLLLPQICLPILERTNQVEPPRFPAGTDPRKPGLHALSGQTNPASKRKGFFTAVITPPACTILALVRWSARAEAAFCAAAAKLRELLLYIQHGIDALCRDERRSIHLGPQGVLLPGGPLGDAVR